MGEVDLQAPQPGPMPIDHKQWLSQLDLSNFVNTYYQYRDIQRVGFDCKTILIIGPGQGFEKLVLEWKGYRITTFDIDDTFKADVTGSVHDLSMFKDGSYDVVIASHVLEHLAEPYLDSCLREISRVGRSALIYLPVHGRHMQVRLIPGFKGLDLSWVLDIYNYFEKPDGVTPKYMEGQHYWEVGMRGYRVKDLKRRLGKYFQILRCYRNRDWLPSQNFVLHSSYRPE